MLILHFDYPSPASAIAVLRLHRIADAGGAVRFAGTDTLGLDLAVPVTLDQLEEIAAWRERAAAIGLDLRRPRLRPPTLRAHLVGDLADDRGVGPAWRERCLRAYWEQGRDLGDEAVLADLATEIGLDARDVQARCGDRGALSAARQRGVAQHRRGIGGVPVLEVDGTFLSAHLGDRELTELAAL